MSRFLVFLTSSAGARKYKFVRIVTVVTVLIGVVVSPFLYDALQRRLYPREYSEYIERYSAEYEIDPWLVYSIILCESDFESQAVSTAGACGLMQLMPATFSWICQKYGIQEEGIFNPETNIRAGCAYIYYLSEKFPHTVSMLSAYNAGEGRVCEWLSKAEYSEDGQTLKTIPYKETDQYVKRVLRSRNRYYRVYSKDN